MLAGETLDRWIGQGKIPSGNGHPVLYVLYYSDWLNPHPKLDVEPLRTHLQEVTFSSREYFLFNRSNYVQRGSPFPDGVPPEFVIEHRGLVQAWVFRGDKLKPAFANRPLLP